MFIVEGILSHTIYDGLKFGVKSFLGPYFTTFQKAQKKAQEQLKKEFSEGELLSIFTTFNNMEWKLSYGKNAREEIERNLIKGIKAIDGQVFVDELVAELHENCREYEMKLVKKVVGRFVEIVGEELRGNREILNYLQYIDLQRIKEKIDSGIEEISESQRRLEQKVDYLLGRTGEPIRYQNGIPQSENLNLRRLFEEGQTHLDNYEYDSAIKAFRAGLALQGLQASEAVALLIHIGIAQYEQSKWDEAKGTWKEALNWAEKGKDEWGQATALGNLGLVYKAKGEWDKAIEFYNKDLEISKKIGDEHGMAQTFNNLGNVYQLKGEWDKAIEFYNKALKGLEKLGDEHGMAQTFGNLGNVYQLKGEWDKAIEFYNKSLKIKEKLGDEHGMAQTFNNLGNVYQLKGEWDKAIEFYNKSLKIKEKLGDEHGMAQTFSNMGNVYQLKGEWDKAIEFYNKSLKIKEKLGDEHGMAQTKGNIGILYKEQGKKEEARRLLEESLETLEKIGDRPNAEIVREHLKNL
ncbi:MAG: tetratricopeptide repeat protein [Candidatus Edwardsbacteria bacterium]